MEPVTGHVLISEPVAGEQRHVLPDALRLGAAHLKVADLDRATAFYEQVVGLRPRERGADAGGPTASLGTGGAADVIVLHERPRAHAVRRHSGLYHVALLYSSQLELARVAQRIAEARAPIQGASDHGTHEAIYLADPDGNGLELAADRPRDRWPDISNIDAIAPQPLDMGNLFNVISGRAAEPHADPATAVGHVHLHVGDIAEGLAFYRDLIGFDLVARIDSAAFVSAGGYHHHLAFNIWQGHGAPPSPPDAAGLHHWSVELPAAEDVQAVRERLAAAGHDATAIDGGFAVDDPWSIALHVITPR